MKKALIVYGGWEGHHPLEVSQTVAELLKEAGFAVELETELSTFEDAHALKAYDLIIPNWTMGEMSDAQAKGLSEAVEQGTGLGGWHGGAGDAFRTQCYFQFMVGGQFVGHPGNNKDYTVDIADPSHPVTQGLSSFTMQATEQYYMHIDPAVQVLATTVVNQPTLAWLEGTVMPVAWVRPWGQGRVYYCALGHKTEDFSVPSAQALLIQGLRWASR